MARASAVVSKCALTALSERLTNYLLAESHEVMPGLGSCDVFPETLNEPVYRCNLGKSRWSCDMILLEICTR